VSKPAAAYASAGGELPAGFSRIHYVIKKIIEHLWPDSFAAEMAHLEGWNRNCGWRLGANRADEEENWSRKIEESHNLRAGGLERAPSRRLENGRPRLGPRLVTTTSTTTFSKNVRIIRNVRQVMYILYQPQHVLLGNVSGILDIRRKAKAVTRRTRPRA
jgi:hypothetical protein